MVLLVLDMPLILIEYNQVAEPILTNSVHRHLMLLNQQI